MTLLWGLVISEWHWVPHWYSENMCCSITLCSHSFRTFPALQWCFLMLSVGHHSIKFSPRYLRCFVHLTSASWNVISGITLSAALCCQVWMHSHNIICALFTLMRYLVSRHHMDTLFSYCLHCFGCLLDVPYCFVYVPVVCRLMWVLYPADPILGSAMFLVDTL